MKKDKAKGVLARIFAGAVTLNIIIVTSAVLCSAWESKVPEVANAWRKAFGYKAADLVGKVAPEIKEGMVIDGNNFNKYPGLKDLLMPSLYKRLDPSSYAPLAPIKIVKTDQYHLGQRYLELSLKNVKACKLKEDNLTLTGYHGGFPFLHPQNGNELIQWADNRYNSDTLAIRPMRLRLYGRNNKPEREMRQHINFFRYKYTTDWREEINPNPENINYVVSGIFIYPRDISGTSYVRKRFVPAGRADEFLLYVASMRRIRRMSGRDTQDPLFGSDLLWDDYNSFWQKLSATEFPNDYKMKQVVELLSPTNVDYNWPEDRTSAGYADYNVDEHGEQAYVNFGSWQRRPFYCNEITSLDSNYVYSKRILMFCMETGQQPQEEMYDRSGALWRSWVRDCNLSQTGGGIMENLLDIVDHSNDHRTVVDCVGVMNPRWMGPEYADVRFLSRKAK